MKMRTAPPRPLTILAAAGALALSGCTEGPDDTASPETVTATQTVETGGTPQATTEAQTAPTTEGQDTTDPGDASPAPTTDAPTDDVPAEELPRRPVGSEVTIAGEPATVCIHGDGWGTNIWAGNANTSCEFVTEAHNVLVEGLNATEQNIRDHLKQQITVQSPVTGQDYELTCVPRGEALVTCSGGENAAVHFY